jgi:pimeloyl-ACP methyl ester carboxylesterase
VKSIITPLLFFFGIHALCAQTVIFPKPTGPYCVGTKAIEVNEPKRFMVQAFYPSQKHEGTCPYMPGTLEDGFVEGIKVLVHAKPDAPSLETGHLPTIIFVPGLGMVRQAYTILCEELASHGYLVLSVDLPYVSSFVKFNDGTKIVLTLKDAWKLPRDREYRYVYYDKAMEEAIESVTALMHEKRNYVLMGHSFGGNVAHTLGFRDNSVATVVDIDSKITERKIFGRIGVPPNPLGKRVLFIRGMMQYQEDVGDQLTRVSNAIVWQPNVQHSAFSDNAYLAAKIKGFGQGGFFQTFFNWFFKRGPHFDCVDTSIGDKDVDRWYADYKAHVLSILK